MRWVDRGPEPAGVAGYARQFTPGWVAHFENDVGGRPTDSYWREFRTTLGIPTNHICWYCERQCYADTESGGRAPTVDHFRPISRFPQLAYEWSNWIFSCQRCNGENKKDKWPETGYVDPCAADAAEWPDKYFDYDLLTGDIEPKKGLPPNAQRRAWDTIDDLGLNKLDVKIDRMACVQELWNSLMSRPVSERQTFVAAKIGQAVQCAGAFGMVVEQLRQSGRV